MENENKELINTNEEKEIKSFSSIGNNSNTICETHSNIDDPKLLFNLETHVDCKLNDCVGESIKVKKVLIKEYYKPMEKPIVDEETGDIIQDVEKTVSCILIDEAGKSYATGSKTFANNMKKFLGYYGGEAKLDEGVDIKIVKVEAGEKGNKALSFELL